MRRSATAAVIVAFRPALAGAQPALANEPDRSPKPGERIPVDGRKSPHGRIKETGGSDSKAAHPPVHPSSANRAIAGAS